MKINKIKKKYKDEWVVAESLKEDDLGKPTDAKVLYHSKSMDDTYKAL